MLNKKHLIILLAIIAGLTMFFLNYKPLQNMGTLNSSIGVAKTHILQNSCTAKQTQNNLDVFSSKLNAKQHKNTPVNANSKNYYFVISSFFIPANSLNLAKITPDFSHSFTIGLKNSCVQKTIAKKLSYTVATTENSLSCNKTILVI